MAWSLPGLVKVRWERETRRERCWLVTARFALDWVSPLCFLLAVSAILSV
ncbi:UNVERIFIED_CONTAM: hypothetical protein FKN15_049191 [Acipenser sinensis]